MLRPTAFLRLSLSLSLYIYIYIYTHTHTHTHIYMCVCICLCAYMYVYILKCILYFMYYLIGRVFIHEIITCSTCKGMSETGMLWFYSHRLATKSLYYT